jgi:leishmanolysin-like peptidase
MRPSLPLLCRLADDITSTWLPLRIVAQYTGSVGTVASFEADLASTMGSADGKVLSDWLKVTAMPAVITRLGELYSTSRVTGNLFAYRACGGVWDGGVAIGKCAQLAEASIGCNNMNGEVSIPWPAAQLGAQTTYNSDNSVDATTTEGSGLPNADFSIFITGYASSNCAGGTLAYASTCQRDQYDRPTYGRANVCASSFSGLTGNALVQALASSKGANFIGTMMHEVMHALGFASSSWPLHRNKDAGRTPKTARSDVNAAEPAVTYTYSCGGSDRPSFVPAENTIAFLAERGMAKCAVLGTSADGLMPSTNCVRKFVSPAVVAAARAFYACPTLNGMELENQMTSACELMGSHWEQRVANGDMMSSFSQHVALVTPMTLALMEDSGWYKADYTKADGLKLGDWGFHQGCDFATAKCLTTSGGSLQGQGSPPHFLAATNASVCTTDRLASGAATVVETFTSTTLPAQYRYFPTAASGGSNGVTTMDFCPAIFAYSNGMCSDTTQTSSVNRGTKYSAASVCVIGSLVATGYGPLTTDVAGCYAYTCNSAGDSLTLTATGTTSATAVCGPGSAGLGVTPSGWLGHLVCPDPASVCGPLVRWNPYEGAIPTATYSAAASATASRSPPGSTSAAASATASSAPTGSTSATATAQTASATGSVGGVATVSASSSSAASVSASASAAVSRSASASAAATRAAAVVAAVAVDCSLAINTAKSDCATISALSSLPFDLGIPLYSPDFLNKGSDTFMTVAGALVDTVASSVGVVFKGSLADAVTFIAPPARMLVGGGARSLSATSCTATINVPVPASSADITATTLSGNIGSASQTAVAVIAARMVTLFSTPTATTSVFNALSAVSTSMGGAAITAKAISAEVSPSFVSSTPGLATVLIAATTPSVVPPAEATGVSVGAIIGIIVGAAVVGTLTVVALRRGRRGSTIASRSSRVLPSDGVDGGVKGSNPTQV